jgi:outer membrane immunogenic protein
MKKTLSLAALVATAAFGANPAMADEGKAGGYVGAGYTRVDGDGTDLNAATLRGGYRINDNFGVEGEYVLGLGDKSETVLGVNVKTELGSTYGVYGVGFLPLNDKFDLFARLGYGNFEAEASAGAIKATGGGGGVSGGVGGQFWVSNNFAIRGEYTRYETDDGSADTFGVSGVIKF